MSLLIGGVLGLLGTAIFALGARECWFAARVYLGDPTPVASAVNDPGPVELQGTARPDEGTTTAPFSGAECLVCEWEVQQSESSGQPEGGVNWKTLDQGLRGGPFRLIDETASCRVEPAGSVRHFEEHEVTVPAGTELPDRLREFVASNPDIEAQTETVDIGLTEIFLGNEQRFAERRLDPGEDCYVYGYAHYDPVAGTRGGEVNLRVDGDVVRRFLIADSRERGVVREQLKIGIVPVLIGGSLLVIAGALLL